MDENIYTHIKNQSRVISFQVLSTVNILFYKVDAFCVISDYNKPLMTLMWNANNDDSELWMISYRKTGNQFLSNFYYHLLSKPSHIEISEIFRGKKIKYNELSYNSLEIHTNAHNRKPSEFTKNTTSVHDSPKSWGIKKKVSLSTVSQKISRIELG